MHTHSAPLVSTTRYYGVSQAPYTPLDTWRLPRIGRTNDLLGLGPGLLGVVLQDGTVVQVDEPDYYLIRERGWVGRWTARKVTGDNTYPSINHGDRIQPLARVILDARHGETVRYRNGNRNDLTRANLMLKAKGGKEISFSNRSCPQAPSLTPAESARSIAAVAAAVGTATPEERVFAGIRAVHVASGSLLAKGSRA